MAVITEVEIQGTPIDRLAPLISPQRIEELHSLAESARRNLGDRRVININSTATGGGVAEMMQVLLAYAIGSHINVKWLVIQGSPDFFTISKRIHNALHGSIGDGGALGESEHASYEAVLDENAKALKDYVRAGDIVILHDPQTAGLLEAMRELGATVIWRCHVGSDNPTPTERTAWDFLRPYLETADAYIFTRKQYAPDWLDMERTYIIQPSIDPLSPKNVYLTPPQTHAILNAAEILNDDADGEGPKFDRSDGTVGSVVHPARIYRSDGPPPPETPIVVQVSRWDKLKDMEGVLKGFVEYVRPETGAHLMLVGPEVDGVADDPEGKAVLDDCVALWQALPEETKARVHLVVVPMTDRDENAIVINALQRRANVVVQKSIAEGFGLTVTEAMWKGRPIIASRIGGIPDQIVSGEHGILINDTHDLKEFGEALNELLNHPESAEAMGANARTRTLNEFLPDRHLEQYVQLFRQIDGR